MKQATMLLLVCLLSTAGYCDSSQTSKVFPTKKEAEDITTRVKPNAIYIEWSRSSPVMRVNLLQTVRVMPDRGQWYIETTENRLLSLEHADLKNGNSLSSVRAPSCNYSIPAEGFSRGKFSKCSYFLGASGDLTRMGDDSSCLDSPARLHLEPGIVDLINQCQENINSYPKAIDSITMLESNGVHVIRDKKQVAGFPPMILGFKFNSEIELSPTDMIHNGFSSDGGSSDQGNIWNNGACGDKGRSTLWVYQSNLDKPLNTTCTSERTEEFTEGVTGLIIKLDAAVFDVLKDRFPVLISSSPFPKQTWHERSCSPEENAIAKKMAAKYLGTKGDLFPLAASEKDIHLIETDSRGEFMIYPFRGADRERKYIYLILRKEPSADWKEIGAIVGEKIVPFIDVDGDGIPELLENVPYRPGPAVYKMFPETKTLLIYSLF